MTKKMTITDYIKEGIVSLKNIKKDKAEYKAYMVRVEKLPDDYKKVFKAVNKYVWSYSDTSGKGTMKVVGGLLEMFEEGATQGIPVKQITGEDVGEFADGLVKEIDNSWVNSAKDKLTKKFQD